MNRLVFEAAGSLGGLGRGSPGGQLHINTASHDSMSGGLPFADSVPIYPIELVPEGGICRVEPIRRRQRCTACGCISWWDDTITCPGCSSQVFEDAI